MRHFETNKPTGSTGAGGSAIGRSFIHESAIKQVAGKAIYIDDKAEEVSSLHAYPVLSTISSGKIASIDTTQALAETGVIAIYSAKDIPGKNDIGPVFSGDILLTDNLKRSQVMQQWPREHHGVHTLLCSLA